MVSPGEEGLEPRVVYEDSSLVAVHKPPRMHSAPGLGPGDLCAWVFARYPEAREAAGGGIGAGRSPAEGGLLHRLDFETSGLVLFARSASAFRSVLGQQREGTFHKTYLALCTVSSENLPAGSVPLRGLPCGVDEIAWTEAREGGAAPGIAELLHAGVSAGPLSLRSAFRPFGPRGSRVACRGAKDGPGGQGKIYESAILSCETRAKGETAGGSAWELRLEIGLTRGFRHQVRAQLAWIGLPLSGDALYGGAPDERLRLYATRLELRHPETGETLSVMSKLHS